MANKNNTQKYYEIYRYETEEVIGVLPFGEEGAKEVCDFLNAGNLVDEKFVYRPSTKEAYEKHEQELEKKLGKLELKASR